MLKIVSNIRIYRHFVFSIVIIIGAFANGKSQNSCPDFEKKNDEESLFNLCIDNHRNNYIHEFFESEHSPIKLSDTSYFNFFKPNPDLWLKANYTLKPDSKPFELPTSSGNTKTYRVYAELSFEYNNNQIKLSILQSQSLKNNPEYRDYLFIPFMDKTNGEETYEGGRYLDLRFADLLKDGTVLIDFNKAYNPYCAFSSGYSCPIPPLENRISIAITAGEKKFLKPYDQH
jgi:uncharacterized protein